MPPKRPEFQIVATMPRKAMPLMSLEVPIGVRTAYGVTAFIFPMGTPVPTSTREVLFTSRVYKPGDFYLQLVQGFNLQSIFNTHLGALVLHIPEEMPKQSEIHLIFLLEASGLTVYAEHNSIQITSLHHFYRNVVFPPTTVTKFHHRRYSTRLELDKKFLGSASKKHVLAEYVEWVTVKLNIATLGDREDLVEWIAIGNKWIDVDLDFTEAENQHMLNKVRNGCNGILNPRKYPSLVQDSAVDIDRIGGFLRYLLWIFFGILIIVGR